MAPSLQIMGIHYFEIFENVLSVLPVSAPSLLISGKDIFPWKLPLPLAPESLWFRILTPPILTPRNWPVLIFQIIVIGSRMGMLVRAGHLGLLLNQFRKRSPFN